MVVTALVAVFAWFAMQSTAPLRDALAGNGASEHVATADGGQLAGEFGRQARAMLWGIATVVIFIAVIRLVLRMRRGRREADVAQQLRQLGGQVLYDFQAHQTRRARQIGWLARWVPENYLGRIVSIDLSGCEAGDDHLTLIRSCQQLEKLDLSDTQITVGALQRLGRLPCLQTLAVRNLEIKDDEVRALAGLRRLRLLDATGCAISPTAAAALESMPRLSLVERQATLV
jgi:hypothetical protein